MPTKTGDAEKREETKQGFPFLEGDSVGGHKIHHSISSRQVWKGVKVGEGKKKKKTRTRYVVK